MQYCRPICCATRDELSSIPSWFNFALLIDLIQGGYIEQSLIQRLLERFWIILRDVPDLSGFGNKPPMSRGFNRFLESH
jgi:hypothetical protein